MNLNKEVENSTSVLWNSNSALANSTEDEPEVKPLLADICRISNIIQPHSAHDFSIHVYKIKEYGYPDRTLPTEPKIETFDNVFSDTMSRFQQKCSDSFAAQTCCGEKRWTTEEVSKVISIERTFFRTFTIIIRFPDKKVNNQVVRNLNKAIRAVNFLQSPYARRCTVTLKDSTLRADVLTMLNSSRFGSGFLSADGNYEELIPSLNEVDPFTLFLDNITPEMERQELIDLFPSSQQITIGYTNKIYCTKRYAFIIFLTVKDAIDAFKKTNHNSDVLVRFRRFSGSAHLPTESEIKKCQSGVENSQRRLPIFTDSGPPVLNTRRNYKIVQNVTIKTEPSKADSEIVLDDDNTADGDLETVNYCPNTDFDKLYENLRQSRMQMSMLKEME